VRLTANIASGENTIEIAASAATDTGRVRRINEDSLLAAPPVFLVADGMGGHDAGDLASAAVREAFAATIRPGALTSTDLVLDAVAAANASTRLLTEGRADAIAGSTVAAIALVATEAGTRWMIANVGDSRVYQWNGRTLRQVSVDHSVVQELLDRGAIDREEAARHPARNVITRAIGASVEVDCDVWLLPVTARQTFLLCSDGLTRELDDERIARILIRGESGLLEKPTAEALIDAAVAAGGADNVTAIVVDAVLTTIDDLPSDTTERIPLGDTRPRR
jgi:serine/threonine protein phosphatase PrpC